MVASLYPGFVSIDVPHQVCYAGKVNTFEFRAIRYHFPLFLLLLTQFVLMVGARPSTWEPDQVSISPVRQLRNVSPEQAAKRLPVRLQGVVTFCDSRADLGLFVHDATGSIYIKLGEGTNNVKAGDFVEVKGKSGPGDFVPVVNCDVITVLGSRALPVPKEATYEELATGSEDSQWVEVRGNIRAVVPSAQGHTLIELLTEGQRLSVLVTHYDVADPERLIGATVRVKGVCRTRFNNRRQMRAPFLSVTSSDDIIVASPTPPEVVEVPLTQLFQFNPAGYYGKRVRVQGQVTAQNGGSLFIQDKGASLSIKTHQTNIFSPGDIVAVTGFPLVGQYSPVLEDAVVRRLGRGAPPTPINVRMDQLASENYDCDLVRLRGHLVNRVQRGDEQIIVLESDDLMISARLYSTNIDNLSALKKGSELELTGICLAQPGENWTPSILTPPESFRLLLRSAGDAIVIQDPPWWTLTRLLTMLCIMTVILLAGFAWVFVLDRRVRQQTAIIQQKIQREAVLEERTRIAREFHDTLEQELVAITIQLETVADQFDLAPQVARQMLDLAYNMTRRSLFEARRSVWDLRSHLLENRTLVGALEEAAKLMSASSRVPITVGTSGASRKLPAQAENNLLRITQEALANALKHAHATKITVNLDYDPSKVCLRVQDNGSGFDTDNSAMVYAGHFGLLDMSERAEKMGGTFSIVSLPANGTEIIVEYCDKEEATGMFRASRRARLEETSQTEAA